LGSPDIGTVASGIRREHLGTAGAGNLDRDVPNAASAPLDQNLLPGLHVGSIDEPFPCSDEDQRQRCGFPHGQVSRLGRKQICINRGEFRK
jgi:hypothetical protein